jgi:Flp pilus assembly pilin Flp
MLILFTHSALLLERAVRPVRPERGTSLVEYCLLMTLLALACFAALHFFGGAVSSRYSGAASSIG